MKQLSIITILSFLILISFPACDQIHEEASQIHEEHNEKSADEIAVDELVKEAYAAISFEEGSVPDSERIRNVFIPDAVFINFRFDTMTYYMFPDFIGGFEASAGSDSFRAFQEREIAGETEIFGKIAHRISTYITYINDMENIAERGINSFQCIKTADGWKVNSVIWDVEKEGQDIPTRYDGQ